MNQDIFERLIDTGNENLDIQKLQEATVLSRQVIVDAVPSGVVFGTLLESDRYRITHHREKPSCKTNQEVFAVNWEFSDFDSDSKTTYGYINGLTQGHRLHRELEGLVKRCNKMGLHRIILALSLGIPLDGYEVHHVNSCSWDNRSACLIAAKPTSHKKYHRLILRSSSFPLFDLTDRTSYVCFSYDLDLSSNTEAINNEAHESNKESRNSSSPELVRQQGELLASDYPEDLFGCMSAILKFVHDSDGITKTRSIQANLSAQEFSTRQIEKAITQLCRIGMLTRVTKGAYLLVPSANSRIA